MNQQNQNQASTSTEFVDPFERIGFANLMMENSPEEGATVLTMNLEDLTFELGEKTTQFIKSSQYDGGSEVGDTSLHSTAMGHSESMADTTSELDSSVSHASTVSADEGSSPQKIEGKVSKFISKMFKSKFEKAKSTQSFVQCKIKGQTVALELPPTKSIAALTQRLKGFETDLNREIIAVSYFLDLEDQSNETAILDKFKKEVIWVTKLKHKSELKRYMDLKLRVAWLVLELNQLHSKLMTVVVDPDKVKMDDDARVFLRIEPKPCGRASVDKTPMARPVIGDHKLGRMNQESFLHIRDFIFFDGIKPKARLFLAGSLDQDEFTQLVADPFGTFMAVLRYTMMPEDEFSRLMFCTTPDDKVTKTTCPCGIAVTALAYGVQLHLEDCKFKTFLNEHFPTLINNGIFSVGSYKTLTTKERDYMLSVIKSRLPQERWKETVFGRVLELHQSGQRPKVIDKEIDYHKQHSLQCSARSSCYECRKRAYESKTK